MKYPFIIALMSLFLLAGSLCAAWDGFDADSGDLVEIMPDAIPSVGDRIEVHNYDQNKTERYHVESVRRNRRTIEVVVHDDNNLYRTLVMEGR